MAGFRQKTNYDMHSVSQDYGYGIEGYPQLILPR